METVIQTSKKLPAVNIVQKSLLFCGILASLWYVAINIIAPMQYPGYSISSQTVSELSAIAAPTRPLWVLLCIFYSMFVIAFGWGVWRTASGDRHLRIVGALFMLDGFIGFFWPPMHQREVLAAGGGTLNDTLHIVFAFVTVLLMILAIGFGAVIFGKKFRFYSIVTLVVMIAAGIFTGIDSPKISANLPTPWIGIWERINIGVYMLWVIVFAILLLQKKRDN
jgi:hypothetical protein